MTSENNKRVVQKFLLGMLGTVYYLKYGIEESQYVVSIRGSRYSILL
jgi:hypothetical protein